MNLRSLFFTVPIWIGLSQFALQPKQLICQTTSQTVWCHLVRRVANTSQQTVWKGRDSYSSSSRVEISQGRVDEGGLGYLPCQLLSPHTYIHHSEFLSRWCPTRKQSRDKQSFQWSSPKRQETFKKSVSQTFLIRSSLLASWPTKKTGSTFKRIIVSLGRCAIQTTVRTSTSSRIFTVQPKNLLPASAALPAPSIAASINANPAKQLPRIIFPQFSGNFIDWADFQDLFVSLVNQTLTNVEQLHYLKTSITGESVHLLKKYLNKWRKLLLSLDDPHISLREKKIAHIILSECTHFFASRHY